MNPGAAGAGRRDAAKLAGGRARFADELALRDLLHAAVLRSPHAHARVLSLDAGRARAPPGVAAVLTADDLPALLPRTAVYAGQPLALAAAEDAELAQRACDALAVRYEPLAPSLDPEAVAHGTTGGATAPRPRGRRRADAPEAGDEPWARVLASCDQSHGDVEAAAQGADDVREARYRLPFAPGLGAEPPVVLAWLDEDRRLAVRTSTRSPFAVRRALGARLGLPLMRVRVAALRVASAERAGGADVEALAGALALATGRPVRLAVARDEELVTFAPAPAHVVRVRSAWRGGALAALDVYALVDAGAAPDGAPHAAFLAAAARHALGLYPCPAARLRAALVRTHHPPAVLSSDTGAAGVLFALECHVDEAAAARGEDPLELRRRLLSAAPDGPADGRAAHATLRALLDAAHDAAGPRGVPGTAPPAGSLRRGRGLALAFRAGPAPGEEQRAAALDMNEDGSFRLRTGSVDAGSGCDTALALAAAGALGVDAARVAGASGDTDVAPCEDDAEPAFARAVRAVTRAAHTLRRRLVAQAARRLECDAGTLRVADGSVTAADGRAFSFAEIARLARQDGECEPFVATSAAGGAGAPAHACALAELAVDVETGELRVRRLVLVLECGTLVDAGLAVQRAEGALLRAAARALAEQQVFDAAGQAQLRSLRLVQPPRVGDLPQPVVHFVPGGAEVKDVGDLAGRAVAAALANALAAAAGARVRDLPLTPERVCAALRAALRGA